MLTTHCLDEEVGLQPCLQRVNAEIGWSCRQDFLANPLFRSIAESMMANPNTMESIQNMLGAADSSQQGNGVGGGGGASEGEDPD